VVLRRLRLDNGYSQDSYAHQTGYHRNYIGQLERGEKSPSLKALFDFAESFHLEPSDLLKKVERCLQQDSVRRANGSFKRASSK